MESTEVKEEYRGVVGIPYWRGLSEQFKRILLMKHLFRTIFKPSRNVKEVKSRSQKRYLVRKEKPYSTQNMQMWESCLCWRDLAIVWNKEERTCTDTWEKIEINEWRHTQRNDGFSRREDGEGRWRTSAT